MWIDFFARTSPKWSDVEFFILSYNTVLRFFNADTQRLFEEFEFKTHEEEEIDFTEAVLATYDDGSIEYKWMSFGISSNNSSRP